MHSSIPSASRAAFLALVAGAVLASCAAGGGKTLGNASNTPSATSGTVASASQSADKAVAGGVNPASIPMGDGHVSTVPKVGYVDSCITSFRRQPNADGPWINAAAGTWNSLTKPSSSGAVSWQGATYSVGVTGSTRTITANDLPIDHPTGTFPVTSSDPTSQWDHNPNSIVPHPTTISLPLDPSPAAEPSCVGMGPIGILNDGVFLFNALDAAGVDGGAHEVFDQWGEHPDNAGMLHHHFVPSFIMGAVSHAPGSSTLVGYAADGYGIYVQYTASGNLVTNANLDACHGTTSPVLWNGKVQSVYHYDATLEYPYTVGCFRGTPDSAFTAVHSS